MSDRDTSGNLRGNIPRWGENEPELPNPSWPRVPSPGQPASPDRPGPVPPTRVWVDPQAGRDALADRLLQRRIVLASGILDDPAASRLMAQLLALDADGDGPVRLELQNLQAELPAALAVMGVLDVLQAQIVAYAGGETGGPALGVLASCPRRLAYPNATFTVSEPRLRFGGTVTAVTAQEQQAHRMTDTLFYRIAEASGRDVEDVREDARQRRILTVAEAIGYGLIHERAAKRTR